MTSILKKVKRHLDGRLKDGKDITVRGPGIAGVANGEVFDAGLIGDIAADIDSLMDEGDLLKDGGACKVVKLEVGGREYAVKRYNWRGWIRGLRYMIKGSRARRVWICGHLLSEIGVRTPQPLCWLEKRKSGIVRESYIISEYVEGERLYNYLCNESGSGCDEFVGKMQQVFSQLDMYRITHGDMKLSNILVVDSDICLIDLDALVAHRCGLVYAIRRRGDIRRFLEHMDEKRMPEGVFRKFREAICET